MRRCLILLALLAFAWPSAPRAQLFSDVGIEALRESEEAPGEPAAASASGAPAGFSGRVYSAADVEAAPVYYLTSRQGRLLEAPREGARVVVPLPFREMVRVLERSQGWALVQYGDERGYAPEGILSNLWLRISKSRRLLYVYRGPELVRTLPADVSPSDADKEYRSRLGEDSEYRIPEGTFFVTRRNPNSRYYRAFVINYPNGEDAARGLRDGRITRGQYDAILRAERTFTSPPMNTALGGLIEIHGSGSGRQRAWTRGCVALRNVHMDQLWEIVEVGTPVVIEP